MTQPFFNLIFKTTGHIFAAMYAKLLKKNQILDAGLECFYCKGYNGTGVKDIVDAAGVPKGSFYNYFESKEAFAIEALDRLYSQRVDELRRALFEGDGPIGQRILGLFEKVVCEAMEQEFYGGCLVGNLCQEMAGTCEAIRGKVSELMDQHIGVFAEAIAKGQEDGSINADLDARSMAEFMFAAWEGTLIKIKADRSRHAFDVFLKHAAIILKP